MLWHKLKYLCCVIFLLATVGCSTVKIGQLDENVISEISSVSVLETSGRAGQLYGRALREALYLYGQKTSAYELTSSISVSSSSTLSAKGAATTYRKMTMTSNFELTEQGGSGVLLKDTVTADVTLGTALSLFGQDQSELHARDRMANLLAQRVAQRVQLYFLENADH